MTPLRCPVCGQPHDLDQIEPVFARPDAFVQIPPEHRERRANHSDEGCILVSEDGQRLSYYLRTVLRVPIRGDTKSIGWGVWAELEGKTYMTLVQHAEDPDQASLGEFPARLANRLPHYPDTLGLPGWIQLTGVSTRPAFRLAADSPHPFALEALEGVLPERALEWRMWSIHPPVPGGG